MNSKYEISLQTQENISKRGQFYQNLIIRFSLNFPNNKMAIICASLVEVLCAKFVVSFQTHENIFILVSCTKRYLEFCTKKIIQSLMGHGLSIL